MIKAMTKVENSSYYQARIQRFSFIGFVKFDRRVLIDLTTLPRVLDITWGEKDCIDVAISELTPDEVDKLRDFLNLPIDSLQTPASPSVPTYCCRANTAIPANSYTATQLLLEREHRNDALVERMKATEEMREGAEEALKTASADFARLVIKCSQSHKVVEKLDNEIATLKRTYKRLQDRYRKLNGGISI